MPPRLFHRDDARLPYAHTFHPDLWLENKPAVTGNPPQEWPLVPFSGGPGVCPGRNVVLLLGSAMLAALIHARTPRLTNPQHLPPGHLPGRLDNTRCASCARE